MVWQSIAATFTCTHQYTCPGSYCYQHAKCSNQNHVTFVNGQMYHDTRISRPPKHQVQCCEGPSRLQVTFGWLLHLRDKSYEPVGSDLSVANRLFAMYHARINDSDKSEILSSLKDPYGKCRLLFCTVAFGMGVNIPGIRYIIHYSPPTDIDNYFLGVWPGWS